MRLMCPDFFQKQFITVNYTYLFMFDFLATVVVRRSYNTRWRNRARFRLSTHEEEYPGRTWSLSANQNSRSEQSPKFENTL